MKREQCPVCFDFLAVKAVAPCFECGHREQEIEHALAGKHTYAEMRIFGDLTLVLCNFCMVDFGSYHPEYFGLPPNARIGFDKMQLVRELDQVQITKDKCCPTCGHRLPFLEFLVAARELHSNLSNEH
ncbi:MAG: hypothetical protein JNM09_18035 [Blastocatellia bacterium]|nr:hypothetical protein [Blastocatellia bacterium]